MMLVKGLVEEFLFRVSARVHRRLQVSDLRGLEGRADVVLSPALTRSPVVDPVAGRACFRV
jgi:hypothetical protein